MLVARVEAGRAAERGASQLVAAQTRWSVFSHRFFSFPSVLFPGLSTSPVWLSLVPFHRSLVSRLRIPRPMADSAGPSVFLAGGTLVHVPGEALRPGQGPRVLSSRESMGAVGRLPGVSRARLPACGALLRKACWGPSPAFLGRVPSCGFMEFLG